MPFSCPVCNLALEARLVGIIEVDVCNKGCKGIFFEAGELKKVREIPKEMISDDCPDEFTPLSTGQLSKDKSRLCPKCKHLMARYNYSLKSDIFIDLCHKCSGVWLDQGELKSIINYDRKNKADSTRYKKEAVVNVESLPEEFLNSLANIKMFKQVDEK